MERLEGKVVQVLGDMELVVNRGHTDGVRHGNAVLVYAEGDEVLDPDTQESLGRLELIRGRGVAKHVQDRMTTIRSTERRRVRRFRSELQPVSDVHRALGMGAFTAPRFREVPYDDDEEIPFEGLRVGDLVRFG